ETTEGGKRGGNGFQQRSNEGNEENEENEASPLPSRQAVQFCWNPTFLSDGFISDKDVGARTEIAER
ncbi:MAG: hypothetical protein ACRD1U_06955, partial [Vicinamibacterales bacterium]